MLTSIRFSRPFAGTLLCSLDVRGRRSLWSEAPCRRFSRARSAPAVMLLAATASLLALAMPASSHPLGNFTINHFARIEVGRARIQLRFVVDMAEISTIQQLQSAGVANSAAPTQQELDSYLAVASDEYRRGLVLTLDGSRLELNRQRMEISLPPGAGGLNTLRIECVYEAALPTGEARQTHVLRFENNNHPNRIGWREIVAQADAGITIFDSSAFGNGVTDELKAYPQEALAAPLDERAAQLSFTAGSVAPPGSRALVSRDGQLCVQKRDRLAELIAVPEITPAVVLLGLLLAAGLGAVHAISPGHGKTVVGAYLVGSRGTARHAAFLGLTVTVTHTAGVFALGLVTLAASQYVLPERLFPFLSLASGAIVVCIGLSLFIKRLRAALSGSRTPHAHLHAGHEHGHDHSHHHDHSETGEGVEPHTHGSTSAAHGDSHDGHTHSHDEHTHSYEHTHSHDRHTHSHGRCERISSAGGAQSTGFSRGFLGRDDGQVHSHEGHTHSNDGHAHSHDGHTHSHGGRAHSHLPPGADGGRIKWKSLLALGISGGLLPCPSALVVLLAAISLHRVAYGLLLVTAFSFGLAGALTAVGLAFVYAGRLLKPLGTMGRLARVVPVVSAFVITCAGAAICWEALVQAGVHLSSLLTALNLI